MKMIYQVEYVMVLWYVCTYLGGRMLEREGERGRDTPDREGERDELAESRWGKIIGINQQGEVRSDHTKK